MYIRRRLGDQVKGA